ncbi:unnamed protein product, partial [Anisakis simplex]|uniref:Plasmodium vivax Vir protein n=1 Tax=Anisakis simplex TaxID=6269 RepID=A0A0M3JM69_ANISI
MIYNVRNESRANFRNIYHLANYVSCLSPNDLTNCSYIEESDIGYAKDYLDSCRPYRADLIKCRQGCDENEDDESGENACDEPCDHVPLNCSTQMIFDIFYRILPKNLDEKPLYVNAFLPIFTMMAYQARGYYQVNAQKYVKLQNAFRDYAKEHRQEFVLK